MNRRLLALLMSVVVLVSALPVQAFASDIMEIQEIPEETVVETAEAEETTEPVAQTTAATEAELEADAETVATEETAAAEPTEETVPEAPVEMPADRIVQASGGIRTGSCQHVLAYLGIKCLKRWLGLCFQLREQHRKWCLLEFKLANHKLQMLPKLQKCIFFFGISAGFMVT